MNRIQLAVTFIAIGLLPLWGQTGLTREGRYWVQTEEGSLPSPGGGRLRVVTVGRISVQGSGGGEIHYSVKKRVKAGSESEALRYLNRADVRGSRQAGGATLTIESPGCGNCNFSADVQVTAPKATQEVELETRGGSVEVNEIDGRVSGRTAGGSIQMDRIGQGVRAETAGGSISLGSIGGPVRCETAGGSIHLGTSHGETVLGTSGGSITADEVDGPLRAETAGGNIQVNRVNGNVTANTSGGSIHLSQVKGSVQAETAGGSITVEGATRGVRAENANGSIRLIDVAGALRATTAAGNIMAQLLGNLPLGDSTLETSVGNIVVLIPDGARLTIRANVDMASSTNRIQCDFPTINIRMADEGPGPRALVAEGAINGGGPMLRIRNSTGAIQIKKR